MIRLLFIFAILFCVTPWASPPTALAIGLLFGLTLAHPWPTQARTASKFLLQASVVALGFSMNLADVIRAGRSGILYTAMGIAFALAFGMLLGHLLKVRRTPAYLISAGTAICGGSAIAAVGPIVAASNDEMSVSLGTVFILNSVALILFPAIANALHLSHSQFGLWAALAIHDTSSVVGAAAKYTASHPLASGPTALAIATTVKLARALWIIPVSLGTAAVLHRHATRNDIDRAESTAHEFSGEEGASPRTVKVQLPWFVFLFVLAAVANTYIHVAKPLFSLAATAGHIGLTLTLFLIGAGLSRKQIRQVGVRPLLLGVVLWIVVGTLSLLLIRAGWIHL